MVEFPRTLKHLTVWLLVGTAVFLATAAWQARQQRMQFQAAPGAVELRRADDGHFHWPGRVNGVAVDFLVDTGATRTAVPAALASRAALRLSGRARSQTANGQADGWVAKADVQLDGGPAATGLPVLVLPSLASPLLGMDVLSRLHFSQQGGVLRFEPGAR